MTAWPPPPAPDRGAHVGAATTASTTTVVMRWGLHLISLLLVVVASARAIGAGASPAAVITIGVAFIAWYALGVTWRGGVHQNHHVYSWVGGLAALWMIAIVISAEFIWLAFLVWLLAGRLLTLRATIVVSLLVFALVAFAPLWHHGTVNVASIIGPLIGAVFAVGLSRGYLQLLRDAEERERLVVSLHHTQQELIDLQDELALAQRRSGMAVERVRIARDVHDTVAQTLPSIRLLAHAARVGADPAAMSRALTQVEELAAEATTDARRIIAALTPADLDAGALGAALDRLLTRLAEETGIQVSLHVDDTLPALSSGVEVALLRTAQSALANVRHHSGADRVNISLIDDGEAVRLDVVDDGVGFDPADVVTTDPTRGFGLGFITGRLRELGGGLEVTSRPGAGTGLSARLPVNAGHQEPR